MKLYTLDDQFIEEAYTVPANFTGIVVDSSYSRSFLLNGRCHRLDGPAFEHINGGKSWYIYGKNYTQEQHALFVSVMKLRGLL